MSKTILSLVDSENNKYAFKVHNLFDYSNLNTRNLKKYYSKPVFQYNIKFEICVCVVLIHSGYFVYVVAGIKLWYSFIIEHK